MLTLLEQLERSFQSPDHTPVLFRNVSLYPFVFNCPPFDVSHDFYHFPSSFGATKNVIEVGLH